MHQSNNTLSGNVAVHDIVCYVQYLQQYYYEVYINVLLQICCQGFIDSVIFDLWMLHVKIKNTCDTSSVHL